jgi:hypothetical protein
MKFTMNHTGNGYILLDSLILGLGNTTDAPEAIPLDTELDKLPVHWESDICTYAEQYSDFPSMQGCSVLLPSEENPFTNESLAGYWSPCLEKSCQLTFFSGSSVRPTSLTVLGYISGSASIEVSRSNLVGGDRILHQIISKETMGEGWHEVEVSFDLYQDYTVCI